MAKSQKSRFKQALQKGKRYHLHRLGENTNMSGINIRKQCLEQDYRLGENTNMSGINIRQ